MLHDSPLHYSLFSIFLTAPRIGSFCQRSQRYAPHLPTAYAPRGPLLVKHAVPTLCAPYRIILPQLHLPIAVSAKIFHGRVVASVLWTRKRILACTRTVLEARL